jgi:hypothetical protein
MIDEPDQRRAMGAAAYQSSARFFMPSVRAAWEGLFTDLATERLCLARVELGR